MLQRKGRMIRNESEKRIDLKKKDMKKTRKKLNTLPTVQPVFGTSLCILERLDMIKGIVHNFLFSDRSHILNSNGVWYI